MFHLPRTLRLLPLAALLSGCAISTPFKWPGFDRKAGITIPHQGDSVVIALTNAVLDSDTRAPFDDHTQRVYKSIATQPGLIGYSIRREIIGNQAWTATIWTDEDALRQFVYSPAHLRAMDAGSLALLDSKFVRIRVPVNALPVSWETVFREAEKQATR
jgi:heme-degrading monooxygenase HmoA